MIILRYPTIKKPRQKPHWTSTSTSIRPTNLSRKTKQSPSSTAAIPNTKHPFNPTTNDHQSVTTTTQQGRSNTHPHSSKNVHLHPDPLPKLSLPPHNHRRPRPLRLRHPHRREMPYANPRTPTKTPRNLRAVQTSAGSEGEGESRSGEC